MRLVSHLSPCTAYLFCLFLFSFTFAISAADLKAPKFQWAFLQDHGTNQTLYGRFTLTNQPVSPVPKFLVLSATECFPGVIPIFSAQKQGLTELRWRPPRGQEIGSEPIFFAWPPSNDPSADWAGFWKCHATRADGSKTTPDFEITLRNGEIAGRFNHHTENKFAALTGGSISNGTIRIEVNYIQDNYRLTGKLLENRMEGTWQHLNGEETGAWQAQREHSTLALPVGNELVDLFEWSHNTTHEKNYLIAGENPPGNSWQKNPQPLCRVLIAKTVRETPSGTLTPSLQ